MTTSVVTFFVSSFVTCPHFCFARKFINDHYLISKFRTVPPRARPPPRFSPAEVTLHAIPPKELVTYAKETQTKELEPEGKMSLIESD